MNKRINFISIDVDSMKKEFYNLKNEIKKKKYKLNEKNDLLNVFYDHCKKIISLLDDFPIEIETKMEVEKIYLKVSNLLTEIYNTKKNKE